MFGRAALAVSVMVLLQAALGRAGDASKGDEALLGTWIVVSEENDGRKSDKLKDAVVLIDKTNFTIKVKGTEKDLAVSYKADAAGKPKTIDLILPDGDRRLGIYELTGDMLKICASDAKDRPTDFTAPEGSKRGLLVLRRDKK